MKLLGGLSVIKNTAQGGVFITDTPHHFFSAYISAFIGVLKKAHFFYFFLFFT